MLNINFTIPGAVQINFLLDLVNGPDVAEFEQAENRTPKNLGYLITTQQADCRVGRNYALRLISNDNAGWRVGKNLLRKQFAFFAGAAFTNVSINGDEAAIG